MRIALTGSGGTGKTVTALEVASMLRYRYIQSQARIVFERHKAVSIERDINQDPEVYAVVQFEILMNQIKTEHDASKIGEDWVTERTVLDTVGYFTYWSSFLPKLGGKWKKAAKMLERESLRALNMAAMHLQESPYDNVFVLPSGRVPLRQDSYRSGEAMYQHAIDLMIRGLIQRQFGDYAVSVPMTVGNERQTAEWIVKHCGISARGQSAGIADEVDRVVAQVDKQRPECIIMDRECNILPSGQCTTCGREDLTCPSSKSDRSS